MFGIATVSGFHKSSWSNELIGELQIVASILLFGAAFIWQRSTMLNGMGPVSYNACRYVISTVFLCFLKYGLKLESRYECNSPTSSKENLESSTAVVPKEKNSNADLWFYGVALGLTNFSGSILQQIGLVSVTAGKTGFITGMYVVMVPIVEYCIPGFNSNLSLVSWTAAGLSFFGLFLLSGCMGHEQCIGGAIKSGEVIVFLSMLSWVVSIMLSDSGAKKVEVVTLTLVDFAVTTIITVLLAFIVEPEAWVYPFSSIRENWVSIVLVGLFEATSFTLSTWGQMYTPPTRAALLYSLEAVVCAILAYFSLGEVLTHLEILGGVLMFVAALVSSYYSEAGGEKEKEEGDTAEDRADRRGATAEETQPIVTRKIGRFDSV